ncbi:hypothetical protein RRG08_055358 [Elysia crispata]|uniref:Uncharacterized protein n=1 Tax=Elysia crispata TaxID=231223 RepID=A0AAE1E2P7_9GAST|nr:hypothetical protein RRG08_055358 [Elysia crispata]
MASIEWSFEKFHSQSTMHDLLTAVDAWSGLSVSWACWSAVVCTGLGPSPGPGPGTEASGGGWSSLD